ncbi:hypothetical protein GMRT_10383 [Giardia muris]|uniref:Uncharacterized protein n=1 Tax=Giardia muris TaxID=5742 RepID=A0A4Z1SW52_GIAMU|nr:hypothetical protein GMRT_10383 [Giardia muris]|eukprot:TNJ30062.1 hypothetical protein GMRT_10383 [Giardia muris]
MPAVLNYTLLSICAAFGIACAILNFVARHGAFSAYYLIRIYMSLSSVAFCLCIAVASAPELVKPEEAIDALKSGNYTTRERLISAGSWVVDALAFGMHPGIMGYFILSMYRQVYKTQLAMRSDKYALSAEKGPLIHPLAPCASCIQYGFALLFGLLGAILSIILHVIGFLPLGTKDYTGMELLRQQGGIYSFEHASFPSVAMGEYQYTLFTLLPRLLFLVGYASATIIYNRRIEGMNRYAERKEWLRALMVIVIDVLSLGSLLLVSFWGLEVQKLVSAISLFVWQCAVLCAYAAVPAVYTLLERRVQL